MRLVTDKQASTSYYGGGVFIDGDEIVITKKEDLINTYIENDHGELRDLYLSKCKEFNITVDEEDDWYDWDYVMVDGGSGVYFLNTDNDEPVSNQLTLSDLKPHTRTEYEKVTESIFDLRDEFERGELYQKCSTFKVIGGVQELATCINVGNIYRKVEIEIDERQDFIERAKGLIDASKDADYSLGNMFDAGCRFQD